MTLTQINKRRLNILILFETTVVTSVNNMANMNRAEVDDFLSKVGEIGRRAILYQYLIIHR